MGPARVLSRSWRRAKGRRRGGTGGLRHVHRRGDRCWGRGGRTPRCLSSSLCSSPGQPSAWQGTIRRATSRWTEAIPASVSQVTTTVLCVLTPVLLAARRGSGAADLGLIKPGTVTLSVGVRVAAWAVLAFIVGGITTAMLATGSYPDGPSSYPNLTLNVFHAVQAGFIEEVVVLAFVVTTLEQARRPLPEIIALGGS